MPDAHSVTTQTRKVKMSIWIVRATWSEDDTAAAELWAVNAPTAVDAVREASSYVRYPPQHIEARPHDPLTDPPSALVVEPGQAQLLASIRQIPA